MRNNISVLIIGIMCLISIAGIHTCFANEHKVTYNNNGIIDSLKHEIAIRDTIINQANEIMDNNNVWDMDGSDIMADYLQNCCKLYDRK